MADNIEKRVQLTFETNASETAAQVKILDQSVNNLDKTFDEVYGDLKPLTARMGELEDRMYELALAGKQNTEEFIALQAEAGRFKQTMDRTNRSVDAASLTLNQKLAGALGGVSAGFSAAMGAAAVFGVESSKLQETMVRLQGVMALSQGIQGLRESATVFTALGTSAKVALAGIRTGIAATGIGVLVLALGAIVAYWDDIKSAVSGVDDEMTNLQTTTAANVKANEDKLTSLNGQENVLKLQGKSEKEILDMKIKQKQENIKALEAQIIAQEEMKKAQVATAKRNQEILSGIINFIQTPLRLLLQGVDAVGSAFGKNFGLAKGFADLVDKGSSLIFDPKAVAEEGDKSIKATKDKLAALNDSLAADKLKKNDINKKETDKANEDAQKAKDALLAIEQKYAKDIADLNAKTEQEKLDARKKADQEELDAIKLTAKQKENAQKLLDEKYAIEQKELDKKRRQDNIKTLEDFLKSRITKEKEYKDMSTVADVNSLRDKNNKELQEQLAADLAKAAALGASLEQLMTIKTFYDEKKKENEKNASDASVEITDNETKKKAEFEQKKDEVIAKSKENLTNIISGLEATGLAKSKAGQAISKTIALTQIGIDSAVALGRATKLANAEGDAAQKAFPTVPGIGTAARIISYVSTAASVASNIMRAKQLLSGGGGGGGSEAKSGGSTPAAAAPNVSFVSSNENQVANAISGQQSEAAPVRAYVVSADITTAQSLDRNLVDSTTLGD